MAIIQCQTIINRVWVVKKSISLSDENVDIFSESIIENYISAFLGHIGASLIVNRIGDVSIEPKKNIFNIEKRWTALPKHWAIILELSNGSYVNIQFGKKGFSLKEYNKEETQIEGEN